MGNSGINDVEDFVVGLLLFEFLNDSAWNVDDLDDYLIVESAQLYLLILLCGDIWFGFLGLTHIVIGFLSRSVTGCDKFEYHLFGVSLHYLVQTESFL